MKLISRMAEEERIARELEMAAEVQRHLFPADGLEMRLWRSTAPASSSRVGGDYYTILKWTITAPVSLSPMCWKGNRRRIADVTFRLHMLLCQLFLRTGLERCRLFDESPASTINGDGGYATFFLPSLIKRHVA